MHVLILGKTESPLVQAVSDSVHDVIVEECAIDVSFLKQNHIDFIVSYGYRHIISQPVLEYLPDRIVNLHISLLPWNRGADPNLWSFLEDSPKGVSIHLVNRDIDGGDILTQKEISFSNSGETLASTYLRLSNEIVALFVEYREGILEGKVSQVRQPPGGSYHRSADKKPYECLLKKGWHTPVEDICGKALDL